MLLFIVCAIAGLGAGIGTGLAGLSAAVVISPMLITFCGFSAYEAVGVALASDVLASAVTAYTYGKNKNLDIKNGLLMMASVLFFTVIGSWLSSLLPNTVLGGTSYVMTIIMGIRFLVFCGECGALYRQRICRGKVFWVCYSHDRGKDVCPSGRIPEEEIHAAFLRVYALSELLVCGECGTPYKRCTWARNGKKRIVWRCVSRLEFGTKYCHTSPTLDEDKLHRAILEAINGLDQTGQEITEEFLDIASLVQRGQESGGVDPLTLRQRLAAVTAEQAVLMEQALALPENMENEELNAQLREIAEEREGILHQLGTLRQADERQAGQAARMDRLREFVEQRGTKFAVYDDAITRKFVEQITVLDAETVRIKFRYPGLEVDKSLR